MAEMGTEVEHSAQAGNGGEGAPSPSPEPGKKVAKKGLSPSASSPSASGSYSKSERETELEAQVETLAKALKTVLTTPQRKAVTDLTYLGKGEGSEQKILTKSEITAKLTELTRKPDLKKSDRDLITRFYEGDVKVDAIEHLLK